MIIRLLRWRKSWHYWTMQLPRCIWTRKRITVKGWNRLWECIRYYKRDAIDRPNIYSCRPLRRVILYQLRPALKSNERWLVQKVLAALLKAHYGEANVVDILSQSHPSIHWRGMFVGWVELVSTINNHWPGGTTVQHCFVNRKDAFNLLWSVGFILYVWMARHRPTVDIIASHKSSGLRRLWARLPVTLNSWMTVQCQYLSMSMSSCSKLLTSWAQRQTIAKWNISISTTDDR